MKDENIFDLFITVDDGAPYCIMSSEDIGKVLDYSISSFYDRISIIQSPTDHKYKVEIKRRDGYIFRTISFQTINHQK